MALISMSILLFGVMFFLMALSEESGGPAACVIAVLTLVGLGCANYWIYTDEVADRAAFDEWAYTHNVQRGMYAQSVFPARTHVEDPTNAFYVCPTDEGGDMKVHVVVEENDTERTIHIPMERVRFSRSRFEDQAGPHIEFSYSLDGISVPGDFDGWQWFVDSPLQRADISCPGNGCEVVYCR
jgi:hypothetical protein